MWGRMWGRMWGLWFASLLHACWHFKKKLFTNDAVADTASAGASLPHTPYPIPHTPYPIPHTPYPRLVSTHIVLHCNMRQAGGHQVDRHQVDRACNFLYVTCLRFVCSRLANWHCRLGNHGQSGQSWHTDLSRAQNGGDYALCGCMELPYKYTKIKLLHDDCQ